MVEVRVPRGVWQGSHGAGWGVDSEVMSTFPVNDFSFPVKCERSSSEGWELGRFREGRRHCEELFRRASLLRNRAGQLGSSETLWGYGCEFSVVPFGPGVSWASSGSQEQRPGTE